LRVINLGYDAKTFNLSFEFPIQGRTVEAECKTTGWFSEPTGDTGRTEFEKQVVASLEHCTSAQNTANDLICPKNSGVVQKSGDPVGRIAPPSTGNGMAAAAPK
jgi:hypothetical protein